jgi:hypothetical protein
MLLALVLLVLQFTKYAHLHFLLVMAVVTLMAYERLAFAELFAHQKSSIAKTSSNSITIDDNRTSMHG